MERACRKCGETSPAAFDFRQRICRRCKMRSCERCGETKNLAAFRPSQSICRQCDAAGRVCKKCGELKGREAFRRQLYICRKCEQLRWKGYMGKDYLRAKSRRGWLRKTYRMTVQEYAALETAQEGKCAICCKVPAGRLHVDHCHESGAVRGLLCGPCNRGIGQFGDDIALLRNAVAYLRQRSTPPPNGAHNR